MSNVLLVGDFQHVVELTTRALSDDETRPALTQVEVEFEPECVRFAATNGYLLTLTEADFVPNYEKGSPIYEGRVVVDGAALRTLAPLLKKKEYIALHWRAEGLVISRRTCGEDGWQDWVILPPFDGRLPNWRFILKTTVNHKTLKLNLETTEPLIKAFVGSKIKTGILEITGGKLKNIVAKPDNFSLDPELLQIGFDPKLLKAILPAKGGDADLSYGDWSNPITLVYEDSTWRAASVLMPMYLGQNREAKK